MSGWLDKFDVSFLPEGEQGPWKVRRFEVTQQGADAHNLQCLMSGYVSGQIHPGAYIKLVHKERGVIMSSTPAELRDHLEPWQHAQGSVLINGLGLGLITTACLRKKEVTHVTVVEMDADVIALVVPALYKEFGQERLSIVETNALEYKPTVDKGFKFGMVWHDIWDSICEDNRDGMKKLHRRYGRLTQWQGSWSKWQIDKMRDAERRNSRYMLRL